MVNSVQLMQMMNNPQQAVMQMLNQNPAMKNNPMVQNAINLAQSGNANELKNLASNLANSKGINLNDLTKLLNGH